MVLGGIALFMTIGVYGLVAGIVKTDDLGLYLSQRPGSNPMRRAQQSIGRAVLWLAPWLMKGLSLAGTIAMFLVGGGILAHGIAPLSHLTEQLTANMGGVLAAVLPELINGAVGLAAGALVLAVVTLIKRFRRSD